MPSSDPPASEKSPRLLDCQPSTAEYLHVAKLTALISGIILAIYLAYRTISFAPDVFMIGFLGIIFAVFLASLSRLLGRWTGYGYGWNLAIIASLLFVSLLAFAIFFGTVMVEQVQKGAQQFEAGVVYLVATADEYPALRAVVDSVPLLNSFREESSSPSGDPSSASTETAPPAADEASPEEASPNGEPTEETEEQKGERDQAEDDQSEDDEPKDLTEMAMSLTGKVGAFAARFFVTTFGLLTNLILIVIVGLYLAASPHAYQHAPTYFFPPRVRPEIYRILGQIGATLWLWLLGRLFSMTVSGVGTAVVLYFFDVPSALLIGMITFLLGFIPNLGPLLAMGIAIFFVLPQGLTAVATVVGVLAFFELLESYLVAPLVAEHQVSLPPALVIFFQALMGLTLGFIGLTIAAPLLAVGRVLFNELYRRKLLHEEHVGSAAQAAEQSS